MGGRNKQLEDAMETRGFLTIAEAARRLRVSDSSIYALLDSDEVRGTRIGRRRYVEIASLLEHFGPVVRQMYEDTMNAIKGVEP